VRYSVLFFSAIAVTWSVAVGLWVLGPGLLSRWRASGEPLSGPLRLVAEAVHFVREWPLSIVAALVIVTAISLLLRESGGKGS